MLYLKIKKAYKNMTTWERLGEYRGAKRSKKPTHTNFYKQYEIEKKILETSRRPHGYGDIISSVSASLNTPPEEVAPTLDKLIEKELLIQDKNDLRYTVRRE